MLNWRGNAVKDEGPLEGFFNERQGIALRLPQLDGRVLVGNQRQAQGVVSPVGDDIVDGGVAAALEKFGEAEDGGEAAQEGEVPALEYGFVASDYLVDLYPDR